MRPEFWLLKYNYWVVIALFLIGLYGVVAKNNLIKKVIGLTILQTSIILFYISTAFKTSASIPIVPYPATGTVNVDHYMNPLPHVLMLTAIVVGVATVGVALALIQKIYQSYGSIEENQILKKVVEYD